MTNVGCLSFVRIVSVVGAAFLPACAQVSPPEPQDGVTDVSISGLAFEPRSVTIRAGESVRWTNLESVPISHSSTSGEPGDPDGVWDSGTLSPGESFSETFDEPGEFIYYCRFHPNVPAMVGAKVIVEEDTP